MITRHMRVQALSFRRAALVAAMLALLVACGSRSDESEGTPPRDQRPVPALVVGEATGGDVYRAAGHVRALGRAELGTRMMGRVESIRVRPGDRVQKGQVLATFDRGAQLAARQQAVSAREHAGATLRRMERLYADSAVPVAELEAARAAFEQAEARVGGAAAELTYAELLAPFGGTVTARLADPGDLVAPGRTILVVEDDGPREIIVGAPDRVAAQVKPGDELTVEVGSEGRPVRARVVAIVPAADPDSRTVEIRLATPERLVSNLTAVAHLPVGGGGGLAVPVTALVERGQLVGVMVFAGDGALRLRWIRTGRRQGDEIAVVSGLFSGDVIARTAAGITDGEPARPVFDEEAGS